MINLKQFVSELIEAGVPALGASANGRVALIDGRVINKSGRPDNKFGSIEQSILDKYAVVREAHVPVEPKPSIKIILTALIKLARGKQITQIESKELDKLDI